jgi:hypothetical protein
MARVEHIAEGVTLDDEVKERWVKALRGGEYKQGRRALKTYMPDKTCAYCCLGVLLMIERGNCWDTPGDPYAYVSRKYFKDHDNPIKTLIELNDDKRAGFSQIADYIEANF